MSFPQIVRILFLSAGLAAPVCAQQTLLNASYDVSRELYKAINPAFIAHWQAQQYEDIHINQSHGGSGKQVLAVAAGLEADVVTMNQAPDIDMLAGKGLVDANWREQFPYGATPYATTSVFLVRKGNPKNIRDWDDLTRSGTQVIVPNPKTSGNGRYTYLAAWGYALQKTASEQEAEHFIRALFANVPLLDGGGRGATTTFTQRGVGDVLVTFENEAILIARELNNGDFDIVYPSLSVDASAPVAVVRAVSEKHGSTALARAYLNFLYSSEGQALIAAHHFRPRDQALLQANAAEFPPVKTFDVEQTLGSWQDIRRKHFADGALFDRIMEQR